MKTHLPEGFTTRPLCLDDAPALVEMLNEMWFKYLGDRRENLEEDLSSWQAPLFDLATDTCLLLAPGGRLAGEAELWDMVKPHVRYFVFLGMHPDFENPALAGHLLGWAEARAAEHMAGAPENAQVELITNFDERLAWYKTVFESCGYEQVRRYYAMKIDLTAPPLPAEVPLGFTLRVCQTPEEQREMLRALWEAFSDHWGHVDEPFEDYYQRTLYLLKNQPFWDASLWYIALDPQGRTAGGCLCSSGRSEDPDMGWVNTLGVRREYRKAGLGMAFLRTAFEEFYRRGKKSAGLGVDSSSLTGALHLYENAGMRVDQVSPAYRKIIRAGLDLTTQKLVG